MVKGYWIAHIDVTDPLKHTLFAEHCAEVIERLGGRILVRSGNGVRPLGQLRRRSIVIEFDSYDEAVAMMDDPQHAEALRLIEDHCEIDMVIAPGTDEPLVLTAKVNVGSRDLAEELL